MGSSSPKPTDLQKKRLNRQMKESICKILINKKEKGFGFLCLIPKSKIKILITDTNTLNITDIAYKKKLEIISNNETNNEYKEIKTEIPRVYYMNEKNEIMILEIKDEDNLEEKFNFLEYDENTENNDPNELYKKKEIYLLPYELKDEKKYPVGKIKSINKNDYTIEHDCNNISNKDKFLAPILLLEIFQVIGFNKKKDYGILLKKFIDEFIEEKKLKEKLEKEKLEKEVDIKNNIIVNNEIKQNKTKNDFERNKEDSEDNNSQVIKNEIDKNKKEMEIKKKDILKSYNTLQSEIKIDNSEKKNGGVLKLEIEVDDINKDIYFFDNFPSKKKDENIRENGFMEEINKNKNNIKINIKLLNNEKYKDIKVKGTNRFKAEVKGTYTIKIEFPQPINNCGYMFYDCNNITKVDLKNFEFSGITNMNDMFSGCTNLKNIEFSNEKIKNVKNISYMFNHCINLEEINLSTFDTENVTSMAGMFQHCENLKKINLENFQTNEVTQLSCMFNNCYNLSTITFSNNFSIYRVILMPWMFYGCENLEIIDLSAFQIINLKDMTDMFEGCDKLKRIYVNKDYINIFKASNKNYEEKFISKV